MLTVRAINQDRVKKNNLPVYLFVDCATSLKHFNIYYFSNNPKSAFVAHYAEESKNTKKKETSQCHYCDTFFRYRSKYNKHINIVLVVQVSFILPKITILKAMKIT